MQVIAIITTIGRRIGDAGVVWKKLDVDKVAGIPVVQYIIIEKVV